jgi:hypothetical protein
MDVAATARHEQQTYARNLLALRAVQPDLVARLSELKENDFLKLEKGASGYFTGRFLSEDGQEVLLASRRDPVTEAVRWAEGLENITPDVHTIVVTGMGLGYHVAELLKRLRGGLVVVLESSAVVIQAALRCGDFASDLGLRRLVIVLAHGRGELFGPLAPHGIELMLGTKLAQHPASGRAQSKSCAELTRAFMDYLQFVRSALVTTLHISETTCSNVLRNLPAYLSWPGVEELKDAWKGRAGFCVAAGPSLRKNMHLLREVQGRAPIIAVQTLLRPLLEAGIRPDFITTLDYSTQSQRFYQGLPDVSDVTLIAEPKVNSVVPDRWPGPMRMVSNGFAQRLLREMNDDHAPLPAGATVAHLSFYLARYMGCDPIVLVGQDLGFDGNVYYAPGTPIQQAWSAELNRFNSMEMMEWQRIARMRAVLQKVPDIHGRKIYTDAQMFTYLQQFERDIAATPARVIDATEGGARIAGTEVIPLREVMDQYCGAAVSAGRPEQRPIALPGRRADFPQRFSQAVSSMRIRLEELERMEEICCKVLEPLRKMTEALDDPDLFNRLHAQMDRWRLKIDQFKEIYRLVSDVVQLAELKRVQMDKALDRKELDEIAERREQLARDIQYVSILQEGIASLRRLLNESISLLEGQAP